MKWLWRLLPYNISHMLTLQAIKAGLPRIYSVYDNIDGFPLRTVLPGVGELLHPIGLAAGFDRNASCPVALSNLGFSFLEIGTVTPDPHRRKANDALLADQFGIIDRRSLTNLGSVEVCKRLHKVKWKDDLTPLAVNIGCNDNTASTGMVYDYLKGVEMFENVSHFMVINLSTSQHNITGEIIDALSLELSPQTLRKCWLKIEPNMSRSVLQELVVQVKKRNFGGLVLTNNYRLRKDTAISGHNLSALANDYLDWVNEAVRGELPIISCGGVLTGADIVARLRRGASAVEIYTALAYFGLGVVRKLLLETVFELRRLGITSVEESKGTHWQ